MKLALVGAAGGVGSRILAEALDRGHSVTAITRHIADLTPRPHLFVQSGDLSDPAAFAKLLKGHDAVVSAARFAGHHAQPGYGNTALGYVLGLSGANWCVLWDGISLGDLHSQTLN